MTHVYVHATVKGFHPRNRYRVVDAGTVAESGWSSAAGMWGLPEADRQVCPVPIGEPCTCVVVQRERGADPYATEGVPRGRSQWEIDESALPG